MTKHAIHHTTHHRSGIKVHHTRKTTGASHQAQTSGIIRRGILTSFDPTTYTCGVMLVEATSTFLQGVPIAYHMDGTSALKNNLCAVLFFDQQNYTDALIVAIYPGAGVGGPIYPPGRVTFVPQWTAVNGVTITSGNTNTYMVTGLQNVPSGALGVLVSGFFTSGAPAAYVQVGAHGVAGVLTLGNLYTANGFINGNGIIPLLSDGKIDVKANSGDCTVTLNIYGYVI